MKENNECCGKTGCKCHNGESKKKIGVCNFLGKFTVIILWGFVLFNAFTIALNLHGIKRNNAYSKILKDRLNQPICLICPHPIESLDLISEMESERLDLKPVVRMTIVSEKQKYALSKYINPNITHTEKMPDGTQVTVGIE